MNLERLKRQPNGEKAEPAFSAAETERRLTLLRKTMADTGVEAVVFTSYQNVAYYSGFLYSSFGRSYALVVTPDGHTTVSAGIDAGQPWRRSTATTSSTPTGGATTSRARSPPCSPGGRAPRPVGIEGDQSPAAALPQARRRAAGRRSSSTSPRPSMRQRMIKSAEEIALIRQGARIADVGGARRRGGDRRGRARDRGGAGRHARRWCARSPRSFPDAELRDTWVWFQSGINTDGAHNPADHPPGASAATSCRSTASR